MQYGNPPTITQLANTGAGTSAMGAVGTFANGTNMMASIACLMLVLLFAGLGLYNVHKNRRNGVQP